MCNLHIWACFFGFASLLLYLICLLVLCFLNFPTKRKLGLFFSVKLPILGLFFKFTCLFLQNKLASLFYSSFKSITLGTLFQI